MHLVFDRDSNSRLRDQEPLPYVRTLKHRPQHDEEAPVDSEEEVRSIAILRLARQQVTHPMLLKEKANSSDGSTDYLSGVQVQNPDDQDEDKLHGLGEGVRHLAAVLPCHQTHPVVLRVSNDDFAQGT